MRTTMGEDYVHRVAFNTGRAEGWGPGIIIVRARGINV